MCQCRYVDADAGAPFGAIAQNLVNSYDPTHSPPEFLRTVGDLKAFLARHGLPALKASAADLARIRTLRHEVRAIFEARNTRAALTRTNDLLRSAHIELELKGGGGSTPAMNWRAGGPNVVARLSSAVALNLAFLLELYGVERLRVCAADPCIDVFVDVSKQSTRQYCDIDCASRARIARFRARRRAQK